MTVYLEHMLRLEGSNPSVDKEAVQELHDIIRDEIGLVTLVELDILHQVVSGSANMANPLSYAKLLSSVLLSFLCSVMSSLQLSKRHSGARGGEGIPAGSNACCSSRVSVTATVVLETCTPVHVPCSSWIRHNRQNHAASGSTHHDWLSLRWMLFVQAGQEMLMQAVLHVSTEGVSEGCKADLVATVNRELKAMETLNKKGSDKAQCSDTLMFFLTEKLHLLQRCPMEKRDALLRGLLDIYELTRVKGALPLFSLAAATSSGQRTPERSVCALQHVLSLSSTEPQD
jgi:hypothetical protein